MGRDPIGYEAGASLYAYTGNIPTSRLDPSGTTIVVNTGIDGSQTLDVAVERGRFPDEVLQALQSIIGDCAKLSLNIKLLWPGGPVASAEISYSNEKPGCTNEECWLDLKRALDDTKQYDVNWYSEMNNAYWSDGGLFSEPGAFVNPQININLWEIHPDGGAIGAPIGFPIVLWHELIGHGYFGFRHEELDEKNVFEYSNTSDYYDPTIACENSARRCMGLRERVWKYRYPEGLPREGQRIKNHLSGPPPNAFR